MGGMEQCLDAEVAQSHHKMKVEVKWPIIS